MIFRNVLVVLALVPLATSRAQDADSASLAQRVRALEERVQQLEAQRAHPDSGAAAKTVAPAGPRGFYIRSADGAFQLRIRGLLQADTRLVDNATPSATTFLLRRARPFIEATMYRIVDLRLIPDFGLNTAVIQDANIDLRLRPWFVIRGGKFKAPIGLERLQPVADIVFVERSLTSNLSPSRDAGLQVGGDVRDGMLSYALGVFNGALDGGVLDLDNGSQKDVDARVFATPFRTTSDPLQGLGVGVGFSTGAQYGSTASPALPTSRTPAQVTVFAYRSDGTAAGTTISYGTRRRLEPQAYWYGGPVGLMAEYALEHQDVRRGATDATLAHSAWSAIGNVVLSGEKASFRGVTPAHPFGTGGRGAFEIGARVSGQTMDAATFPTFSDPAVSVRTIGTVGGVFTWYLGPEIRLSTEIDQTHFTGGAAGGNRQSERSLLIRLQDAF